MRTTVARVVVGACLLVAPFSALAEEWETVMTGPITVRTRALPNTSIKEVWAEGILEAEVQDVQAAILDAEAYPRFMPYFKESRFVSPPADDGSRLVYSRMALPFVSERDYVLKVIVEKQVADDGSGEFKNRWISTDAADVPSKDGVVRLKFSEGSWHVRPLPDGRSKVTYKFAVDPGGWVPGFAADIGNKKGVSETFRAVETEAKQRALQRKRQAALLPPGAAAPRLAD